MLECVRIVVCRFAIALLMLGVSGCSSLLSNSEDFYKDMPRRRINWREYLTD